MLPAACNPYPLAVGADGELCRADGRLKRAYGVSLHGSPCVGSALGCKLAQQGAEQGWIQHAKN